MPEEESEGNREPIQRGGNNLPSRWKEPGPRTQETSRTPYNLSLKRLSPRDIVLKLSKINDKERILKAAKAKKEGTYKGERTRLSLGFSAETL